MLLRYTRAHNRAAYSFVQCVSV